MRHLFFIVVASLTLVGCKRGETPEPAHDERRAR